ncbi:MAG TPA: amidohydrolase family protein [Dehalococcoidia bacterium]|nr:amidohydrolase family protein [Dehalococcoidia bacterium]
MAEPPDLWEKRLPGPLGDRAPHFPNVKPLQSPAHLRAGGWDPHERLRDQAYDGISAEVLFPTLGQASYGVGDPVLEEACIRVYNDWLIDFCSVAPDRLWGLAMISLWDVDSAVKELERCKCAGLRGASLGVVPAEDLPYSSDHYERFWAACQDLEMSVNFHILSGPGKAKSEQRFQGGRVPIGVHKHKVDMMNAVGDMIIAGVLERYPRLNVVVAEAGVGWIPFFAQEFDYYHTSIFGEPWKLPYLPSEYIYRQVYGAFISDGVGGYLLGQSGQDTFMWSNDYPHGACIWPLSAGVIARDLGHLEPEAREKITAGNAAKLYNGGRLPPPADPPGEVQDMTSWDAHWQT